MAFLMAIGLAFAGQLESNNTSLDRLYINQNGTCESIETTCNELGTVTCTYLGFDVYRSKVGTQCVDKLTHWPGM